MVPIKYIVLFILSSFFLISFAQEKVYVAQLECQGCKKQTGITASIMLADFMRERGRFEPLLAQFIDTSSDAESFNEARESAELMSTKYFVNGIIYKIEDQYYVRVSLFATSSALTFWSDARQTNKSSDLPILLKDIAVNMASEKSSSEPGSVYLVGDFESKKVIREKSNMSLGLITGAMVPLSESKIKNVNAGFGGQMSFDARNFILQGSAEVYFANDSLYNKLPYKEISNRYYNLNINVLYPLSTKKNTPFVSLGSGFSYRESEMTVVAFNKSDFSTEHFYDNGLMFTGGGGYILKRNANSSLFVYARGYAFVRDFDTVMYGVMLNVALQFEAFN